MKNTDHPYSVDVLCCSVLYLNANIYNYASAKKYGIRLMTLFIPVFCYFWLVFALNYDFSWTVLNVITKTRGGQILCVQEAM